MKHLIYFLLIFLTGSYSTMAQSSQYMFVSSGTKANNAGIFVYDLGAGHQKITLKHKEQKVSVSSYLNLHPNKPLLYSAGNNMLSAFRINKKDGSLSFINQQSTGGENPCYVSVDKTGKWAFVANYSGGSISFFPIQDDGSLGKARKVIKHEGSSVNKDRQNVPHPHMIAPSPNNKFVLVPDLGADKIFIYKFDASKGTFEANDTPFAKAHPGAGPRHLAFHPNKNFCYVLNELNATVTVYQWDPDAGVLTSLHTYQTLPEDFKDFNKTADIHLTEDGKYLYTSNRGHNSLALFKVNADGSLRPGDHYASGGDFPRNFFILSNTQLIAANRKSGNMVFFDLNPKTGALTSGKSVTDIPSAQCIKVWNGQ